MTRDRNATEERLIEAGFQTLGEGGFSGFGINGVARTARCDKKLIYRYFGDLDGLLEAMGERVARDLAAALAPAIEPRPDTYAEMIERLAFALLDHQSADPRFRQLRAVELLSTSPAAIKFQAARGRVMQEWMHEARGELVPPEGVDAPALNAVLIAAVEGLAQAGPAGLEPDAAPRARAALLRLLRCGYVQTPMQL